jgi:hypothetical protein
MPSREPKLINDLQAARTAASAATQKRALEFQRRTKKLFSKADINTAAQIIADARAARNRASLAVGSNAEAREACDLKARKTLDRLLSRALPGFAEFQSMKKAYLRDHAKAVTAAFSGPAGNGTHVQWGDLLATDDFSSEQFGRPFQVFDLHHVDPDQLISNDQSFVSHSQGTMMNAFDFTHHYSGWPTVDAWFGLHRPTPASALVSCGINYTMPRAGRLRVSAVMQNYYSEVLYSIRDHFGLSYGTLDIQVNLFIAFMRGGNTLYRPSTILSVSRSSDGDNLSGSLSGFDTSSPYSVTAESDESLPANDVVQLQAGCEVHIESDVDDMTNRVNAVVRWQLMKLAVSVI